jgi:crossover junction endodeoxyribonuclease RuvC
VVTSDGAGPAALAECGAIRPPRNDALAPKLQAIYDGVTELLARHRPDALAVEDVFYAKNVRSTVVLSHARGVILLAGQQAGVPVHEIPPAEITKAITGTGIATTEQVQFMVTKLLRLTAAPEPLDASDGIAAALTCVMAHRAPSITSARR